uniref:ABC transporter ATP-binding protein n=1 Tax=uncultured bacterium contig00005 TaxID=1181497 RepID=A0A806JZ92_9BACT|nr:ABC transporter ATP-binding protein [uncultured bacterium contig00005]
MKLIINNVTKKYTGVQALSDFCLEIESGGVFGLVGPNGAGKSTLMKILATIIKPTSGEVIWDDVNILKKPNEIKRVLGYLPQDVSVYPNLTAYEFLNYIAALKSLKSSDAKRQISDLLEIFHLSEYKKRRLSDYSGGMRQRVGIACALLGNPQVIIVDEPSVGLDPEERIGLRNLLCDMAKSRIVLLSTHIISDIESTAAQLAVIQKGRLVFHGTPKLFTQNTNGDMEAAYLDFVRKEDAV